MKRRDFIGGMPIALVAAGTGASTVALAASAAPPSLNTTAGAIVNVRDEGAIGDGIHDDHAAIMAAYAKLPDSGGVLLFPATDAYYRIMSPLTFGDGTSHSPSSKQNVFLRGEVPLSGNGAQFNAPFENRYPARIVYAGSARAGHVIKFQGPITAGISGLTLDGNLNADYGLWTNHVFRGHFEDLFVYRAKTGVRHQSHGDVIVSKVSIGAADNTWKRVHVVNHEWSDAEAAGFDIGTDDLITGLDVNRDTFESCSVVTKDDPASASYVIRGVDLVSFINCMGYSVNERRAYAVYFIAPNGPSDSPNLYRHLPYEVAFINCPLIGRIGQSANWNVDGNGGQKVMFWPLASGDMTDPTKPLGVGVPPSQNGYFGVDTRGYFLGERQFRTFRDNVAHDTPTVMHRQLKPVTVSGNTGQNQIFSAAIGAFALRHRPATLSYHGPQAWVWDRMLRIRASGVLLNNMGSVQQLTLGLFLRQQNDGGDDPSTTPVTLYGSGPVAIEPASGYRSFIFEAMVSAGDLAWDKADSQFTLGTLKIYPPNSATGSAASVAIERTASLDTEAPMDLRHRLFATVQLSAGHSDLAVFVQQVSVELV